MAGSVAAPVSNDNAPEVSKVAVVRQQAPAVGSAPTPPKFFKAAREAEAAAVGHLVVAVGVAWRTGSVTSRILGVTQHQQAHIKQYLLVPQEERCILLRLSHLCLRSRINCIAACCTEKSEQHHERYAPAGRFLTRRFPWLRVSSS